MIRKSFTLIETLVAVGVLGVLMVTVGGIMTMSFKAKNSTGNNQLISTKATFVLSELKKNILDAELGKINCPAVGVGNSISFVTKSGGMTTLLCDQSLGQIASSSANSSVSTYNYLDANVKVLNCQDFVLCNLSGGSEVVSINFKLNLQVSSFSGLGTTGIFYETVTPRE